MDTQLDLIKISAARFQTLELLMLDDLTTRHETCPKELQRISINNEINLMPEFNASTNISISLEHKKNIFESLNCVVDHMDGRNTSAVFGVHIPVNSLPNLPLDDFPNRIIALLDKMKGKNIRLGLLIEDCSMIDLDESFTMIFNHIKYIVCNTELEPPESNPLNFARLHYKLEVARTLQLQLKFENIWQMNPTVMLRVGWPKSDKMSVDESNKNFLRYFRNVNGICTAYGIPYFINGAFQNEASSYVGWWYGNLTNISSITERESEFLGFDTWRPEVPVIPVVDNTKQTITIVSIVVLLIADTAGSAFKLNDHLKQMNPLRHFRQGKNRIGAGQFGVVYATEINGQTVAVKVAKERTKACVKSIMAEIKIMAFLGQHPHILSFVGSYTSELKRGCLPFAGLNWNESFLDDLTNGLRLSKPSFASDEIFKTLTDCWCNDPLDRPDFSDLVEIFKRLCPSDTGYAKTCEITRINN
ncbi:unnamed protein product [Orchesella dallaii]|uniref:Protein kinase domain-containing protein n=1 Tax=Orchesella dallaii TaxID=48710 RepID=A0ABP1RQC2_9HEXA